MEENGFDPALRDAIIQWLTQVFIDLNQDFGRTLMSLGGEYWSSLPDGSFQKLPKRVIFNPRVLDEVIFLQNAFWPVVEECAQKCPIMLRHSSEVIGSKHGMRRQYSLQEIFQFILPTPKFVSEREIYLNLEEDPKEVVDRFLSDLQDTTMTKTIFWPIAGLATSEPILLEN
jgi:hypothetical protein